MRHARRPAKATRHRGTMKRLATETSAMRLVAWRWKNRMSSMFCSTPTMPSTAPVLESTGWPAMIVSTSPTRRRSAIGSPPRAVATMRVCTDSMPASCASSPKRREDTAERAASKRLRSAGSQPSAFVCQPWSARSSARKLPVSARTRPSASITTMCMLEKPSACKWLSRSGERYATRLLSWVSVTARMARAWGSSTSTKEMPKKRREPSMEKGMASSTA